MEAATAVEELVRRRVLETIGDRLVVRHDRIRQVAYDDLLPARRIALHGAVARTLEGLHAGELDEVADELGHHFLRAGEPGQALHHLERFAEIATRRYAIDAALASLHQAAEAVEQLPKGRRARHHLDLALRRASVLTAGGRHHASLDVLRACASLHRSVADSLLASEYHYRLAMTTFYLGRYADARPAGVAALQHRSRQLPVLRVDRVHLRHVTVPR
jgi:predicted ATPase